MFKKKQKNNKNKQTKSPKLITAIQWMSDRPRAFHIGYIKLFQHTFQSKRGPTATSSTLCIHFVLYRFFFFFSIVVKISSTSHLCSTSLATIVKHNLQHVHFTYSDIETALKIWPLDKTSENAFFHLSCATLLLYTDIQNTARGKWTLLGFYFLFFSSFSSNWCNCFGTKKNKKKQARLNSICSIKKKVLLRAECLHSLCRKAALCLNAWQLYRM